MKFQNRVAKWVRACFGPEVLENRIERNYRFLEEALELVQACGCTKEHATQLVDYVYGRPVGNREQEIGGVMVTLGALCAAQEIEMTAAGEIELERCWILIDVIREKQARKVRDSALPGSTIAPAPATHCPHGFLLADNLCGPCSKGRPNRTSPV